MKRIHEKTKLEEFVDELTREKATWEIALSGLPIDDYHHYKKQTTQVSQEREVKELEEIYNKDLEKY